MTDRDRVERLERIVLGDGVDEPGILTRLNEIHGMLRKHLDDTAWPARSAVIALILGALLSAAVGYATVALRDGRAAQAAR